MELEFTESKTWRIFTLILYVLCMLAIARYNPFRMTVLSTICWEIFFVASIVNTLLHMYMPDINHVDDTLDKVNENAPQTFIFGSEYRIVYMLVTLVYLLLFLLLLVLSFIGPMPVRYTSQYMMAPLLIIASVYLISETALLIYLAETYSSDEDDKIATDISVNKTEKGDDTNAK